MAIFAALFPRATQLPWIEVNLQKEAEKRPHLDMKKAVDQELLLFELSRGRTVRTYGGFYEDRTEMWKGFEEKATKMIHLGVDFNNLDAGEVVASISEGKVIHVLVDESPFNGWGTKIIVEGEKYYYLYGHLMFPLVREGDLVDKGQILGYIADSGKNGGWFEHLHLQVMNRNFLNVPVEQVDGYEFKPDEIKGVVNPLRIDL